MAIINPHTGQPVEAPKSEHYTHEQALEHADEETKKLVAEMAAKLDETHKKRLLAINNFFHSFGPLLPPGLNNLVGVLSQFQRDMDVVISQFNGSFADAVFHDVGRNEPCPCGSEKKFKKCCLARLAQTRPVATEDGAVELDLGDENPDVDDLPDNLDGGA